MKVSTGDVIYALRKGRGLTQEQLSVQMNVSTVAVSKWENEISMPDISMLCNLADYFEVTVDELLGRKTKQLEEVCGYKEEELYSYTIAEDLITLCNIAREKGLLAIEEQIEKLKSKEPFLQFACTFALNLCQTSFGTPERIRLLLLHYAASERFIKKETVRKRPDYEMIAEVIPEIFSGENVECLKELIASFLGKDLRNRLLQEGFLKGIRKICDENDILLILDEIQCGMGRTGTMFAWQGYDVKPDIMTCAKALGCGVAVGAFVLTERVASSSLKPGDHGTTYGGNPFAGAAVSKVFDIFQRRKLTEHVQEVGNYLQERLEQVKSQLACIHARRGRGLMQGLELSMSAAEVSSKALAQGLLVIPAGSNVLRFVPPLVIEREHVDEMIEKLNRALKD